MIKDLISDLSYDKIQLSQALSRSKLLAYKINNDDFKEWLRKELEGYEHNYKLLPEYRKISCQMFITHSLPNGQQHSKPVMVSDGASTEFQEEVNYLKILEPISIIERQISQLTDSGFIQLTAEEALSISHGDRFQKWVVGGYRKVHKGQFQNIIELTKQKLLDTLLELNDQFPNLTNEFDKTSDNMQKVKNIITNNIYGNNNPINVAVGTNVEQKDINNAFSDNDYSELEKLGIDKKEINDLRLIVQTYSKDKAALKQKALKWFGSVSASVAAKGFYDNLPAISEFIHKML